MARSVAEATRLHQARGVQNSTAQPSTVQRRTAQHSTVQQYSITIMNKTVISKGGRGAKRRAPTFILQFWGAAEGRPPLLLYCYTALLYCYTALLCCAAVLCCVGLGGAVLYCAGLCCAVLYPASLVEPSGFSNASGH